MAQMAQILHRYRPYMYGRMETNKTSEFTSFQLGNSHVDSVFHPVNTRVKTMANFAPVFASKRCHRSPEANWPRALSLLETELLRLVNNGWDFLDFPGEQ